MDCIFFDKCPEPVVYVRLLLGDQREPDDIEFLYANKAFYDEFKLTGDISGKKYYLDFFPGDDKTFAFKIFSACYEGKSCSFNFSSPVWNTFYSFSATPDEDGTCLIFIHDSESILKRAKAELKEENEFLMQDFQAAFKSAIWRLDFGRDGSILSIEFSNEARVMMNLDERKEGLGIINKWVERIHPEDRNDSFREWLDIFDAKINRSEYDFSYRLSVKNGEYRWFKEHGKIAYYEDGCPKFYFGIIVDINDSVELNLEKEEIKDINDLMHFARWNIHYYKDGTFMLQWSDELKKVLGIEDEKKYPPTKETWLKLLHPEDREAFWNKFKKYRDDKVSFELYEDDYRLLFRDGKYHWVHAGGRFHHNHFTEEGYCNGIIIDVDDSYKKQEKEQALEKANNELETLLKRELKNTEVVGSLSQLFFSIFYINLENNTMQEVIVTQGSRNIYGSVTDAKKFLKHNAKQKTMAEFQKTMSKFNDFDTLAKRIGNQTSIMEEYISKDGQWIRAVVIVSERDAEGKVSKVLYVLQNIDAEKDALRRERREAIEESSRLNEGLRALHETIGSAQWSIDYDKNGCRTSIHWSDELRRIIGYHDVEDFPDEWFTLLDLIHGDDYDSFVNNYKKVEEDVTGKDTFDIQFRVNTKDLGWRWFRSAGRFVRKDDGIPIKFYGIFTDIDNQVKLQEENEEQRKSLKKALVDAQNANNAKTNFLSRMSHDIRTPLNGILGLIEINEKHADDKERVNLNREKTKVAANHLLSLVNDVLDMSKLEDGATVLAHEIMDLRKISRDISDIIMPKAVEAGIKFDIVGEEEYEKCPYVYGSPLHLRQIFLNIIGNSIKYNKQNGSIKVEVECVEMGQESVTYKFVFSDTGIGMSKKFLKHIFEPFAQEKIDARSVYSGTGLGMAIVKSLVEKMDGTIEVESEKNVGSSFVLTIPFEIATVQEDSLALSENGDKNIEGVKILVVEDNSLNLEIIQTLLEEEGAVVTTAANGGEAVDLFCTNPEGTFDIIFMDLMMPVLDGLSATRVIRDLQRPDAAFIPIVAMTANAFSEDINNCFEAGMNGHIAKPFDMRKVIQIISRLVLKQD